MPEDYFELKVRASSNARKVGSFVARSIFEDKNLEVRAVGAAAINQALKAIDNASHLVDTADRIGLTTTALQQLSFGFSQASVDADTFESSMDKFNKNIGDAAINGGALAKILKANGIEIRNTNGQIKTSEELLGDYADLIKYATTAQEKMLLVTTAFGKGGADIAHHFG